MPVGIIRIKKEQNNNHRDGLAGAGSVNCKFVEEMAEGHHPFESEGVGMISARQRDDFVVRGEGGGAARVARVLVQRGVTVVAFIGVV